MAFERKQSFSLVTGVVFNLVAQAQTKPNTSVSRVLHCKVQTSVQKARTARHEPATTSHYVITVCVMCSGDKHSLFQRCMESNTAIVGHLEVEN